MSVRKFCRTCRKKTDHDKRVDLLGDGWSGPLERALCFVLSMGASEVMASRYLECEECGRVTRA